MKGHKKDNESARERPMGTPDAPVTCAGPCRRCATDPSTCADSGEGLRGWRLVLGAVGTFLVPLVTCFAGSLIGGKSDALRMAGAAVGLVIGVMAGGVINKLIVRSDGTVRSASEGELPRPLGEENP